MTSPELRRWEALGPWVPPSLTLRERVVYPTATIGANSQAPIRCLFFCRLRHGRVSAASTRREYASASDFRFDLPPELIAQVPAERRDQARLLVLDRRSGARAHTHVHALVEHLRPGDLLVVPTPRSSGRLFGRTPSGGAVELLLIRPLTLPAPNRQRQRVWLCLGKPAKRLRPGHGWYFPESVRATIHHRSRERPLHGRVRARGRRAVTHPTARRDPAAAVHPPPRRPAAAGPSRYQTVFAHVPGAVAAPTAGSSLHRRLLAELQRSGVEVARLTLHVGPGTFLPVRSRDAAPARMSPSATRSRRRPPTRCARPRPPAAASWPWARRRPRAGIGASDATASAGGPRWTELLHRPGPPLPRRRRADHQLPPAALDAADAGLRVRRAASAILAAYAEAVARRLPLLQLRRRDADP